MSIVFDIIVSVSFSFRKCGGTRQSQSALLKTEHRERRARRRWPAARLFSGFILASVPESPNQAFPRLADAR
ncbi:hypothetical protein [Sinorhizobium sp. Sb3]|uniref:hypothetical protein n=1 Tax=Sinorhizobium/Ensifer group TaxID=227292 RepID=UPI00072B38CA|nr:hypothetical protein [Sinorhizobium sp. Sb3]KSV75058.1 hypothetical protein N183_22235 [Sinorhizobium sp. Sb3]